MTHEELMDIAVSEAGHSTEPLPCGVVIAKNGSVVSQTYNSQRKDADATAHAEIKAIALAGKINGAKDLIGHIAYCSCEPCTMCLSAFIFAKVEKVYYKTPLAEVSTTHIKIDSQELIAQAPRSIELIRL